MKKLLLAGTAVLVIAGSTAVYAQHRGYDGFRHHHGRMNLEDRAAFFDAHIAAVKAGLKLTPDQEKLWPPLETAVRDFVKLRTDRANARMQDREPRDARGPDRPPRDADPVARLRQRAETMGENAAALKKIADAADPLYKTLDESQKRRLAVLTRMEGRFGRDRGMGPEMRGFRDDDGERFERGPRRGGPDREFQRDRGPDRL